MWGSVVRAASPSAADALKLTPIQKGVDYDKPDADQAANCTIEAQKDGKSVGWAVKGPDGNLLRMFLDTNGNNVVDQWRYYKNGLEVYRDIDGDFNRKADQFRWFHTAGSRWGLDENEDGRIDRWKSISAEEVSAEAVAAIAGGDSRRFMCLVLTPEELKSLGLGGEKEKQLAKSIARLEKEFNSLVKSDDGLAQGTRWVQFSASMPGIVPSGTNGSTKDLKVYENATAVVQNKGKHTEILIGTLVKAGDTWRIVHVPRTAGGQSGLAVSEFFSPAVAGAVRSETSGGGPDEATQKLLGELEDVDRALATASDKKLSIELNAKRADIIDKIASAAKNDADKSMWLRQMADTISAAAQMGTYPQGADRLASLFERCQKSGDNDLAAYVRFRQLTADYGLSLQGKNPDFQKIQERWLESLKQFVKDYPKSNDAAEAMLQLAIANEFSGDDEKAKEWYAKIVKEFPQAPVAQKADGARRRLDSVGKPLALSGKSPSGKAVDIEKYRGKAVLVQYWATWCDPAKAAMPTLRELISKYPDTFQVLGVSLDNSMSDLKTYLEENDLPWPQIFESGGLDSRPANEFGILTVPTMVLIDKQGKVVRRNIPLEELDKELKKLLGPASALRNSKNRKIR